MSSSNIRSNFARDSVVMLDGSYPLKFNSNGEARCPAHFRSSIERLMVMRPNRFWIVEEESPAPTSVVEESVEQEKVVELDLDDKQQEEVVELDLDDKQQEDAEKIDLSYLSEEVKEPAPKKKRGSRKKKQSKD